MCQSESWNHLVLPVTSLSVQYLSLLCSKLPFCLACNTDYHFSSWHLIPARFVVLTLANTSIRAHPVWSMPSGFSQAAVKSMQHVLQFAACTPLSVCMMSVCFCTKHTMLIMFQNLKAFWEVLKTHKTILDFWSYYVTFSKGFFCVCVFYILPIVFSFFLFLTKLIV